MEEQRTTVKTEAAEVVLDEEEAYSRGAMVAQGGTDGLEGFEETGYEYAGYEEEPTPSFDASSSHAARPDGNKGKQPSTLDGSTEASSRLELTFAVRTKLPQPGVTF